MKSLFRKLGWTLLFSTLLLSGCETFAPKGGKVSTGAVSASNIPDQPQRIALLLPLAGPVSGSAQAIRNGFFAAYYLNKDQQQYAPDIIVLDTTQGNVIQLYQQAVQQGAQVVVGPLVKNDLQALMTAGNLTVPVIGLNSVPHMQNVPNFYEFDLSQETEGTEIANRAWNNGHRRTLLIASQDPWQQNIARAVAAQWQTLGGQVVGTLAYRPQGDLASQVANLLGVNPHFNRDKRGRKIDVTPTRRQDADVIFLIATPNQAELINPLLKFYFAGDLPAYSTSLVYEGSPNPTRDRDLDGISFGDMPWVIDNPNQLPANLQQIRARITTLWPDAFVHYPRLYALGIDAYQLATHFNQTLVSSQGYKGATGILILQPDNTIHRQLEWAKMQDGYPQLLP